MHGCCREEKSARGARAADVAERAPPRPGGPVQLTSKCLAPSTAPCPALPSPALPLPFPRSARYNLSPLCSGGVVTGETDSTRLYAVLMCCPRQFTERTAYSENHIVEINRQPCRHHDTYFVSAMRNTRQGLALSMTALPVYACAVWTLILA